MRIDRAGVTVPPPPGLRPGAAGPSRPSPVAPAATPSAAPGRAARLPGPDPTRPTSLEPPRLDPTRPLRAAPGAKAGDLARAEPVRLRDLLALLPSIAAPPSEAGSAALALAGTGDDPGGEPLTIQGLLADWGRADSPYDLNTDGTVDVSDLLLWLAQDGPGSAAPTPPIGPEPAELAGAPGPADATEAGTDPATPADPPLTLAGLLASWGESDTPYDLNVDGTVDVSDLLQWLAQGGPGPAAGDAAAASGPAPQSDDVAAHAGDDGPLTLQGLLDAWGQRDSRYDLNGDHVVNVTDLLQLLAELDQGGDDGAHAAAATAGDEPPALDLPGLGRKLGLFRQARLDDRARGLADLIATRLGAAGHADRPPAGLRDFIDELGLDSPQKRVMLQRLIETYPAGSSINTIG
ncbi:MAG: hypothetical protein ACYTG1_06490 [Planctomycetota bacterium]|jgi:hypothetical protein